MPEEIIKKAKEEKKEKSLNRKSAAAASNLLKVYEELNKPKKNLSAYLFFSVDKRWVNFIKVHKISICYNHSGQVFLIP